MPQASRRQEEYCRESTSRGQHFNKMTMHAIKSWLYNCRGNTHGKAKKQTARDCRGWEKKKKKEMVDQKSNHRMPAPGFAPGSLAITYAERIGVQRVALTLYGRQLEPLDHTERRFCWGKRYISGLIRDRKAVKGRECWQLSGR